LPSLREAGFRAAFMRSELQRHDLGAVAAAVDQLAGLAEQADPIAREVLAAIVLALADGSLADLADALRARAATHALLPLARLLRKKPQRDGAGASQPPGPDERALPRTGVGRPLTLGERKSLARRSSRFALDRLLRDPHPDVIRNVLVNPRLTEDDVVRLAARRPAFPDVLGEIAPPPQVVAGYPRPPRPRSKSLHAGGGVRASGASADPPRARRGDERSGGAGDRPRRREGASSSAAPRSRSRAKSAESERAPRSRSH